MLRFSFLGFLGFSSLTTFALSGCGVSASEGDFSGGVSSAGGVPSENGQTQAPSPGTLTAGEWDDNLNFSLFRAYVDDRLTDPNIESLAQLPSADRVVITVETADGQPLSGALVTLTDPSHTFLTTTTGSDGRLLFFPLRDGAIGANPLTVTIEPPPGQPAVEPLSAPAPLEGAAWSFTLPGAVSAPPAALDLAFVLDATGSMGDEIEFLKAEVKGIADTVHAQFGEVSIHYGLIVYRDEGDDFVTRSFDFTDSLGAFSFHLSQQFADGGGDQPEAMDQALALVPGLAWRGGNTARMAFVVADAPPHPEHATDYLHAVEALRPKGIRLYPIAASGVDTEAEYFLRVGAEATLGRYLFLTDDSGVGDPHEKPHIPCYPVQKLSKLITRMIASELSGARIPAAQADVIRTVGSPVSGVCALEDGSEAYY
ncbi:MAG: VWA domain-containing protein [Minicystis sp.]